MANSGNMKYDSRLEKIAQNRELRCIKSILKQDLFPVITELLSYVSSKQLQKYVISALNHKLTKNRRHYSDNEVYAEGMREYARRISNHVVLYKTNKAKVKGQINDKGDSLSKISNQDIDAYLNDDAIIFER